MPTSKKILYLQYANPAAYPPLEHSSRMLANDGWEVVLLGVHSDGPQNLQFPAHPRIRCHVMPYTPPGWRQKFHYLHFCIWVIFWTLRLRPRWIYASDPLAAPITLLLSYLPGQRVLYHEHDSPEVGGQRSEVSKFMRSVLWARKQLARRVSLCVLPNDQRAERFDVETGRSSIVGLPSSLVVWNCPSMDEVSEPRAAHEATDFWVLYHGSIVPSRLPPTVLEAFALLPSTVKLCVVGYETIGHKGYVQELKQLACRLELTERVVFIRPVPRRRDLLNRCRTCEIGLAFLPKESEDINQQTMVGASNKPFDYLASGLALLISNLPDWRPMFVDLGYGLACDSNDPKSIATALRWFIDHRQEMRQMGERGRQRILAEWNYEAQFAPVCQQICDC